MQFKALKIELRAPHGTDMIWNTKKALQAMIYRKSTLLNEKHVSWPLVVASILIALFFSAAVSASNQLRIVDGDTIEVDGITYRLHGIDAPEAGQKCNRSGGSIWACGKASIVAMEELVSRGNVTCDNRGKDDFGRTIGVCSVGAVDINAEMVRTGNAWAFVKYSDDYAEVEAEARSRGAGVFQAATQSPWDYRAEKWAVAEQVSPKGCPIKGNISRGGKIYHVPWSPWYSRTKLSVEKGERWFCNEAEALAAGWRAPYWGK